VRHQGALLFSIVGALVAPAVASASTTLSTPRVRDRELPTEVRNLPKSIPALMREDPFGVGGAVGSTRFVLLVPTPDPSQVRGSCHVDGAPLSADERRDVRLTAEVGRPPSSPSAPSGIRPLGVYDDTSLLAEYNSDGLEVAKHDYGADRLIRLTRADEGTRYMTFDGLGSVTGLTDAAGAVTATYHLDAWGQFRFKAELVPSHNRFGFTGHYWDKEASLYYAKARYYDPFTARFTQSDSFLGSIDDPPSLHRYFYANANPTMFVDPSGNVAVIDNVIGGAASVAIGWGMSKLTGQDYQWRDAAVDFGLGFATSGLSSLTKLRSAGQLAQWGARAGTETALDAGAEVARKEWKGEDYTAGDIATGAVSNLVIGEAGAAIGRRVGAWWRGVRNETAAPRVEINESRRAVLAVPETNAKGARFDQNRQGLLFDDVNPRPLASDAPSIAAANGPGPHHGSLFASTGGEGFSTAVRHRGGNRQVVRSDERWHVPSGVTDASIPSADLLGARLKQAAAEEAAKFGPGDISPDALANMMRPGVAHWVRQRWWRQAMGRTVEAQVRGRFPELRWSRVGADAVDPSTGITYDIMSGTRKNQDKHADRMKSILFRMIDFDPKTGDRNRPW